MRKQTVWQRSMTAMEVREDLLEADGSEIRDRSLRKATNLTGLITGPVEARPGTAKVTVGGTPRQMVEIKPADGQTFAILIHDTKLEVIDAFGTVVFTRASVSWTDGRSPWVLPAGKQTIIGDPNSGLYVLERDDAAWAYGSFPFAAGRGNEILEPYWSYHPGTLITPSAESGAITISASTTVFRSSQVGGRIRYHGRQISITAFTSQTQVSGTVVSRLPPSFELTVSSTSHMSVYDVLKQSSSGFAGIISEVVSGTVLRCVATEGLTGPDVSATEEISTPSVTVNVTAKTSISPQPSRVWDEQMMSARRGYPRSAALAAGRLVLADFPATGAADAVALSAAGALSDFDVGAEDDRAILRSLGSGARIRHVVNAGDLLLLSERGCYVLGLRGNQLLTPSSFAPVMFDERGANAVRPILADDTVVFVASGGQHIAAATLDGSSELRWAVRHLTPLHEHLIKSPVSLCGPAPDASSPERRAFVVNGDGTLAAISWVEGLGEEGIGFAPWVTQGSFKAVGTAFGQHWPIVERSLGGLSKIVLERFDDDFYVDCGINDNPNTAGVVSWLDGETASVCWRSHDAGSGLVSGGIVAGMEHVTSDAHIGLNFECEAQVWPVEVISSPRLGTITARVIRFLASVQGTAQFSLRCNKHTRLFGGYRFGDDLAVAPPLMTDVYRSPVIGRRTHPDLAILKPRPGPFRILALGQEVQG